MLSLLTVDVKDVQIPTYNKKFVLEDKKFKVDIPFNEATDIIKNAFVNVLNSYPKNTDVSNIISNIKFSKPYITVSLDDKINEIYLCPVINGDAKTFIKREFTNAIKCLFVIKKLQPVKVKRVQSDVLQGRSQENKDILRKRITSDIDLEKVAFISGLLCSHVEILIHPRECTEKSRFKDPMFKTRGPGKPNKTTAELIFSKKINSLTTDEIREHLALLTSITSIDPNVHNGIGGVFLSFLSECSDLCESMGVGKEFIQSLKDVELFEQDREEKYLEDQSEIRTSQNKKDMALDQLTNLPQKYKKNSELLEKESNALIGKIEKIKLPEHPKVKEFVFNFASLENIIKESISNLSNYPYLINSSSTKDKLDVIFKRGKKDEKK